MSTSKSCRPPCRKPSSPPPRCRSHSLPLLTRPLRIVRLRKVRRSRIASTMSGLGASADCPGSITAGNGDSICEPLINGSPVSVINSVARSGATNYSLNDTVLGLTAALQYWVQSFHTEDAGIRDMLQDIATEEFSHLEM